MILKNQNLSLSCCRREPYRRILHQPLQSLRRFPFGCSRNDPLRIPPQNLFGADHVVSVKAVLGAHIHGSDGAHDVVKQRLVAIAVSAAEAEYARRRHARRFTCCRPLNRLSTRRSDLEKRGPPGRLVSPASPRSVEMDMIRLLTEPSIPLKGEEKLNCSKYGVAHLALRLEGSNEIQRCYAGHRQVFGLAGI